MRVTKRLAVATIILTISTPGMALADTCAAGPVKARGEPSTFQWLAMTKARANWRSRVRATKALGPAYSTWTRAQNRTEDCAPTPRGTVCVFGGVPCKL